MNPNAIVLTPEQYEDLKVELKAELKSDLQGEMRQETLTGPAYYYNIIREMVFHRFARRDKGYQANYEVARSFSCMIRDAFKVSHVFHLNKDQGEAAIKMTQEIIEVVNKYAGEVEG